jgi:AcrR family transcriptional regulator
MIEPALKQATDDFRQNMAGYDWSNQSPTRRRILEEFLRLAIEIGFNSVSMRMVARAVDIKAPSIYAHFPDGRDEIVAESLRWHFHQFGTAILDALENCETPEEYWSALVQVHLTRQLQLPESNLWDLLIATDEMVHFLRPELRSEADKWVALYEQLYVVAAREMGFVSSDKALRIITTLLEGACKWCDWDGDASSLPEVADNAVAMTRMILVSVSNSSVNAVQG